MEKFDDLYKKVSAVGFCCADGSTFFVPAKKIVKVITSGISRFFSVDSNKFFTDGLSCDEAVFLFRPGLDSKIRFINEKVDILSSSDDVKFVDLYRRKDICAVEFYFEKSYIGADKQCVWLPWKDTKKGSRNRYLSFFKQNCNDKPEFGGYVLHCGRKWKLWDVPSLK